MDREFMKSFLNNYYADYQSEVVKDAVEYQKRRKRRYEIEKKFALLLQESSKELVVVFDDYLDTYADELEILLEEMYLMGANDRERMLKGVI